jgi:hypothetical protein
MKDEQATRDWLRHRPAARPAGRSGHPTRRVPATQAQDTSQFHGVNWADPRDNLLWDENVPVGSSTALADW